MNCPNCNSQCDPREMRPCGCTHGFTGGFAWCVNQARAVCVKCRNSHQVVRRFLRSAPADPPAEARANSRYYSVRRGLLNALQQIEAELPGYAAAGIEVLKSGGTPENAVRAITAERTEVNAAQILVSLADHLQAERQAEQIFRALAAEADRRAAQERSVRRMMRDATRR